MSDKEDQVEEEKGTTEINTKGDGKAEEIDLEDAANMDEQVYNERNEVVEDSAE